MPYGGPLFLGLAALLESQQGRGSPFPGDRGVHTRVFVVHQRVHCSVCENSRSWSHPQKNKRGLCDYAVPKTKSGLGETKGVLVMKNEGGLSNHAGRVIHKALTLASPFPAPQPSAVVLQGYLAHKKQRPPRTLH